MLRDPQTIVDATRAGDGDQTDRLDPARASTTERVGGVDATDTSMAREFSRSLKTAVPGCDVAVVRAQLAAATAAPRFGRDVEVQHLARALCDVIERLHAAVMVRDTILVWAARALGISISAPIVDVDLEHFVAELKSAHGAGLRARERLLTLAGAALDEIIALAPENEDPPGRRLDNLLRCVAIARTARATLGAGKVGA